MITRYKPVYIFFDGERNDIAPMHPNSDGEYVLYEDVQKLEAELKEYKDSYVECSNCGQTYALGRDLKDSERNLFKQIDELQAKLDEARNIINKINERNPGALALALSEMKASITKGEG